MTITATPPWIGVAQAWSGTRVDGSSKPALTFTALEEVGTCVKSEETRVIGSIVGSAVGETELGFEDGASIGVAVVGRRVGISVGRTLEGVAVGVDVVVLGVAVGVEVVVLGTDVGISVVGIAVGAAVGALVVGAKLGVSVRVNVGASVAAVGADVGESVSSVGAAVGDRVWQPTVVFTQDTSPSQDRWIVGPARTVNLLRSSSVTPAQVERVAQCAWAAERLQLPPGLHVAAPSGYP